MGLVIGTITCVVGTAIQVDTISFPKRSGYITEVTRVIVAANEDNAAEADNLHFGCSIRVPGRVVYKDVHALGADMIMSAAFKPLQILDTRLPVGDVFLEDEAVMEQNLQLILATRDGGNLAASAKLMYRIEVEDRRETAALRSLYFDRAYAD